MVRTELTKEQHELALERAEIRELERENAKQARLTHIYLKARNHGQALKQCAANEALLEEYLGLPSDLLVEAIRRDAERFIWVDLPASKTDKEAERRDRAAFTEFAKLNGYSENVANFSLAREVLGPGNLDEYRLTQAVRSNALRLSAATAEELEEREAERVDQEQLRLRNLSTPELKEEVSSGFDQRRREFAQANASRVLQEKEAAEKQADFPPLPAFYQGKRVDQKFFKECDRKTMRYFLQRFGDFQCTQAIRGIR